MNDKAGRGVALVVFALLCVTLMTTQFFRTSTGVIGPELIRELGLSPELLGVLSGTFFVALALDQIPVGILLDRIGPRLTVYGLLAIAVAGAIVFATSDDAAGLVAGRFLMGLGCGPVYIGSMVAISRWFPPARFAGMGGILLAVGQGGALLATTPLALIAENFGWRGAFLGMAAVTMIVALVGYAVVRDAPPAHAFHQRQREPVADTLRGVAETYSRRELWFILPVACANYPVAVTIIGLWGAPYLFDIHGLDPVARGNVLLAMALSIITGYVVYGQLDRLLDTRRGLIVFGLSACLVILLALALAPSLPLWAVAVLFSALGLFAAFDSVTLAHARALFPGRLVGRVAACYNVAVVAGAAALQMATGAIAGAFTVEGERVTETGYSVLFGFLAAVIALALFAYARLEDAPPSRDDTS